MTSFKESKNNNKITQFKNYVNYTQFN